MSSSFTSPSSERPLIVGLGGSAGALSALTEFFDALPDQPDEAFVVVLHMPADQESSLAEILSSHTPMPVRQVNEPAEIKENHVYVAPPGRALTIQDGTLAPVAISGPKGRQAPIDQFFRSLAQNGAATVGIILSGTGSDGTVGLRAIEEAGGLVAVQEPSDAEHDLMPRSAIEMSRVDLVLPVAELAKRISEQRETLSRLAKAPEETDDQQAAHLRDIFEQVRSRTGHDFSEYKQSTMLRRVQRRMQVNQISSLERYLDFLREHPEEVHSLQKDLLISVTSFFRDPDCFEVLREKVVPSLFEGKRAEDEIRVWVVGTATGEEAYTLAMLLLEHAHTRTGVPETIQVFATDIDTSALAFAREGRYPEPIAADVPEEYLDRFFKKEGAQYVVKEHVRDHMLFTPHNLLSDPPFSNLDLISCRNLLIYLRRDLQTSVFDLFSYALNQGGYLFLGKSESTEKADEDFQTIDSTHRIYRLRTRAQSVPSLPKMPLSPTPSRFQATVEQAEPLPSEATVHQRLLEAHTPPSVVVNEDYSYLHLSPDAGRYLKHPSGTPRTNIVELVRPELQVKMRSVLHEAFSENRTVRSRPTRVEMNGTSEVVRLVVHPGNEGNQTEKMALVFFENEEDEEPHAVIPEEVEVGNEAPVEEQLRAELKRTKEELRTTVEEYESSQQKLQAANEELRSMNEEYKSMTEELETSKEELQSVNEELKTVNQELEEKVEQLRQANSDLKNVMASTQIGTLFLDRELRIQRYTPRVEELFNVRPEDEHRPIGDLTHHLDYDRLETDAQDVLDDLRPVEREVSTDEDEWFLVRIHPYRTHEDRIDGVVIAFVEITDRREAEQALRRSEEVHRLAVEAAQVGTWDLNLESGEAYISPRMAKLMGYTHDAFADTGGRWQQVVPEETWQHTVHPEDRAALLRSIAAARTDEESFEIEFRVQLDDGSHRWLYSKGNVVRENDAAHLHGATVDVTERQEARAQLQAANEKLRERAEQIQSLSEALTSAEERVRTRISRVLHDEVQQLLVGAKLTLRSLENREEFGDDGRALIEEARNQIEEGVEATRTLSRELSPPVGKESLYDALEWLTVHMENDYGLSVQMEAKGTAGPVDTAVRTLLFHTVRELLFNVVKHAEVDEASLFLVQGEERIRVVVEDEGAGFDPAEIYEWTEGMGLAGLQERIGLIGGQVEIDTAPGEGTRVAFEVPRQAGGAGNRHTP